MKLAAAAAVFCTTLLAALPLYAQSAATPPATASRTPAPAAPAPAQAPAASAPAAPAAKAPSPELARIATMANNMGYTPVMGADGTWFSVVYLAKRTYKIDFAISPDQSVLYIYISYSVRPAEAARMPSAAMLHWNDTHRNYFSVSATNTMISLNLSLPTAQLTPQTLHAALANLGNDADNADEIFDPSNWKEQTPIRP